MKIEIELRQTTPVVSQPEIILFDWALREIPGGERYFVGRQGSGAGRVSSAVLCLVAEMMAGYTASGRRYRVVGPSRLDGNGAYVWSRWCALHGIGETRDVSYLLTTP